MSAPPRMIRTFASKIEQLDDHVLSARYVPYGETAEVVELDALGRIDKYREGFRFGAFTRQAAITEPGWLRRIAMKHLHEGGLGFVGQTQALHERDDGLYGDVSILSSKYADVDELLRDGTDGISIEFHALRGGTKIEDGVRWRTAAHLYAVTIEPVGAYAGARVLSLRDTPEDVDDAIGDDEQREIDEAEQQAADEAADAEREQQRAAHEAWLAGALEAQRALNARFGLDNVDA